MKSVLRSWLAEDLSGMETFLDTEEHPYAQRQEILDTEREQDDRILHSAAFRAEVDRSQKRFFTLYRVAAVLASAAFVIAILYVIAHTHSFGVDDPNADVVFRMAMQVMLIVALFQPFQMSSVVISGCLRGAGDNRFVAVVMIICVACLRPLFAVLAVYALHLGLIGAWMASLIDMTIRMVLVMRRFESGKWHTIKV